MFLSADEIQTITGYLLQSKQRRWLADRGWRFEVTRAGRPIVLRAEMERHMLGAQRQKKDKELNLKAIA